MFISSHRKDETAKYGTVPIYVRAGTVQSTTPTKRPQSRQKTEKKIQLKMYQKTALFHFRIQNSSRSSAFDRFEGSCFSIESYGKSCTLIEKRRTHSFEH